MSDLIDRTSLAEHKFPSNECNGFGEGPAYRQGWNDAIDAIIDNAPSAEPVRMKGKWRYNPEIGWGETWMCSICGEKTVSTIMGKPRYKWCPMCGADMRGEEDEAD